MHALSLSLSRSLSLSVNFEEEKTSAQPSCVRVGALQVNVIVVIAKADTVTTTELEHFKATLQEEFSANRIELFQPEVEGNTYPLAVIGSQEKIAIGGETLRVRQYPWGIVEGWSNICVCVCCVCVVCVCGRGERRVGWMRVY